jgi:dissimilatory sulfite reductase (desulfoviridin) alpha/beta subunit
VVGRCLDHYQRHCEHGERFGEILERTGFHGLNKKVDNK